MLTDEQFNVLFAKTGFIAPRARQKETILKIIDAYQSGKRYVIVNAPVGFGKSAASYTVAQWFNKSYFLTHQKILQDQYLKDFGMPWVASSQNYECNKMFGCNCKQCLRAAFNLPRCENCQYVKAKRLAFSSQQCSLNYAFMFALSGALREQFNEYAREFIVCDEAHLLCDELIARGTIEVNSETHLKMQHMYSSSVSLGVPNFEMMSDNAAVDWVFGPYRQFVSAKKSEIAHQIAQLGDPTRLSASQKKYFRKLATANMYYTQHKCQISDLNDFALHKIDDVVVIKTENSVTLKPLSAKGLFEPLLGQYGDRFLFMSGTILDKDHFCDELNISPNECEYITLDCDFPVENRPINHWPVGYLTYKEKHKTIPLMTQEIDKLLTKYKDVKGIIHTTNYEIAKAIDTDLQFSSNYHRLLFINAKDKIRQLNQFEKSSEPLILVSPSLSEGIDLKNDLSRLCIICKVPYASLGDQWVKRKIESDSQWYSIKTAQTLIQQTGRSVRSMDDHAVTYILDMEFWKFFDKNTKLFPKWWKDALIWN